MTSKASRHFALGCALLTGLAGAGPQCAAAMEYRSPGFVLCVDPFPPPCAKAKLKSKEVAVCENDMQAYIRSVFRYRECQEAATERAVREANEHIEAWKCKRGDKACVK